MVDDGFLIGFEDSSGNFVEVGRFNNTASDVTQPLEIKHQNSGERITLDNSGLKTKKIDDDRLYSGAFPGSSPSDRLVNAVNAASDGNTIFLEADDYTSNLTTSKNLKFVGTHNQKTGTRLKASFTFNGRVTLRDIRTAAGFDMTLNGKGSSVRNCVFFSTGNPTIEINGLSCSIVGCGRSVDILFTSATSGGIVDACFGGPTVTDNGANTVGDI
jgi:hypothetical protein